MRKLRNKILSIFTSLMKQLKANVEFHKRIPVEVEHILNVEE